MTHTFAICAYGESPFLEECIQSVLDQTVRTEVLLATSTPNPHIRELCGKYDIPMYINEEGGGITHDWNFAYRKAETNCVTITHQDDVYHRQYAEEMLRILESPGQTLLYFTDYAELRNGGIVTDNLNLRIKRSMLFPLRNRFLQNRIFVRRRILSFGSPICCPSVTFVKANCPDPVFQHDFRSDEDWQAWERLSRLKGAFVYNAKILMYHRIHEDSETSKIIGEDLRKQEDYIMFRKFWPAPIAGALTKLYSYSQKSNDLGA